MSLKGSCHCKATQFEVSEAPASVTRCTCSICSKRGALWAYYTPEQVTMATQESTSTHRWGSRTVKLHFCRTCGCSTYNESPSWVDRKPDFTRPRIAINARLFDDFDLDAVPIQVLDGKNLW
jgi:hypothetical protein